MQSVDYQKVLNLIVRQRQIAALFLVPWVLGRSVAFPAQQGLPREILSVCEHALEVEVATTYAQWVAGLSFRRQLPQGHGMLFVFDEARPLAFTARNTYVPLTLVFVDDRGIMQETYLLDDRSTNSRRVEAVGNYRLAIELPAGWLDAQGIDNPCPVVGIEKWIASAGNPSLQYRYVSRRLLAVDRKDSIWKQHHARGLL